MYDFFNIGQNDIAMEKHIDILATTLEDLLTWNEVEVQYNSAGAIFNLISMRSNNFFIFKKKKSYIYSLYNRKKKKNLYILFICYKNRFICSCSERKMYRWYFIPLYILSP